MDTSLDLERATTEEFEHTVWLIEGIRIVIRAPRSEKIGNYKPKRAADEGWSITKWLESDRLKGAKPFEITVIDGDGEEPHGRSLLRTVRQTYN